MRPAYNHFGTIVPVVRESAFANSCLTADFASAVYLPVRTFPADFPNGISAAVQGSKKCLCTLSQAVSLGKPTFRSRTNRGTDPNRWNR